MTIAALTESRSWLVAGWTMLHFLWVGGAIGLAAAATRRALRRARPEARYGFALASLMALALAPAAISLLVTSSALPDAARVEAPAETVNVLAPLPAARPARSPAMPAPGAVPTPDRPVLDRPGGGTMLRRLLASSAVRLPWLWLTGAPATFALLATGLIGAERLRRQSRPLTEGELVDLCRRLADAIGLTRPVALGVCERLVTPLVLGVVRPMILLPPAALTGWSPELVEMALLHELAHVRRLDILVNLFQRVVESILFFHPAIWIVSGWIRQEREQCCDRLVVDRTGRPMAYAAALFSLFEPVPTPGATAVAMARNDLVDRIRRILDPEDLSMKLPTTTLALIAALFLIPALLIGSQVAPQGLRDREQPDSARAQERDRPPEPRIPGRIVAEVWRLGEPASKERVAGVTGVIEISPETGMWRLIVEKRGRARLSHDGQILAYLTQDRRGRDSEIWTAAVRGGDPPVRIADLPGIPVWSPDGKQIIVSAQAPGQPKFETWRMDAALMQNPGT